MNILYIKTVCVLKPTSISYLHTHVSDIHVHRLPYQPRTKGDKVFLAFWLPGPSMAFEGLSCGFWWRSNSAKWRWSKIVLHKWPWGVSTPVLNRLCLGGILWWSLGSTTISDNLDVSVNMITVCVYGQLENPTAICIFKYSWLQLITDVHIWWYLYLDHCTVWCHLVRWVIVAMSLQWLNIQQQPKSTPILVHVVSFDLNEVFISAIIVSWWMIPIL